MRAATYVMFGEQHGVDGIAPIVTSSFRRLQDDGFRTLALEMGPWIASQLMQEGVDVALARYPHSVAFDSNGDLELMRTAAAVAQQVGEGLWGLDQASNAIHPYQRLEQLAPTYSAGRMARGAFLKAALQFGEYSRHDNAQDLAALRDAFGADPDPEVAEILEHWKSQCGSSSHGGRQTVVTFPSQKP